MTTHHCQRCGKDWHCDQAACHLSHRSSCDECSAKDGWKPDWAAANGVGELQAATIEARSRLNDFSIGTQVAAGKFRVVRTIYGKKTTVTPLSGWLFVSDAVSFLRAL